MIRLLIADDEHLAIDFIKFIIEKNVDYVEIVATAKSGREAIEKAISYKPDIVFMDIRMPGINGIDAIKEIKAQNNDTMFVIVSAYEYFDYAKDAVNLGVYEYLLKPLNKNKIIETLNILSSIINEKRKIKQIEISLREKINKIIPHMEGQFVYSHIVNEREIKDIEFYEEIFGMRLKKGYIMMGVLESIESENKQENIKISLEKQMFYDTFSFSIKKYNDCLIGTPLLDRIIAYIPVDEDIDIYEIRNRAIDKARKVHGKLKKNTNISYRIGIGRPYNIENFTKSYNEAYMAATISNDDIITHFEDMVLLSNKPDLYPENKEKILLHSMLTGNIKEAIDVFDEIFWWLCVNYEDDIDKIKSRLIELVIIIRRNIPFDTNNRDISEQLYLTKLIKINSTNEIKISFINYMKEMLYNISNSKEKEVEGIIAKAIEYINNNYNKNISLNDVAKELNMSYHYFSKFFKDTIGKNFVDYLTDLRINKSKEILKDKTISIKEICFNIGYNDPNYFSKLFRKVTGMTPTEYRQNSK